MTHQLATPQRAPVVRTNVVQAEKLAADAANDDEPPIDFNQRTSWVCELVNPPDRDKIPHLTSRPKPANRVRGRVNCL
jgi:hypothetical protein